MKKLIFLILPFILQSCFPVSIPPNLEKGKLFEARKFKKQLPNQYAYIFTDPKYANEFYYYINAKFPPNQDGDSETNVPVIIKDRQYYVSFYETEKKSRVVNLIPAIANEILSEKNIPVTFDDPPIVREGTWYIALVITDEDYNDALSDTYSFQKEVLEFSRSLQNEYLRTQNYNSLLLQGTRVKQ